MVGVIVVIAEKKKNMSSKFVHTKLKISKEAQSPEIRDRKKDCFEK
jgi:hypothetical protein